MLIAMVGAGTAGAAPATLLARALKQRLPRTADPRAVRVRTLVT